MNFEKQFMSITELTKTGLSRSYLTDLSRAKGAPIIKTKGNGKIFFITSDLEAFMKEVSQRGRGRIIRR